ncbi:uncharacterized protein LOC115562271 [Drosophila navojoa]|uniref:uncharacterized protein LOC115562271 n=1 Tax=Drosophila navojoa TaxID=7232 RepID=UPI0011BDD6DC|nr:uncharacterized protein LOC115562271 [Drosophila navojoa]
MKSFSILICVFVLYGLVICDDQSSEDYESDELNEGYIKARTRNTVRSLGRGRGPMDPPESYCCFWINQDHPALPDPLDLNTDYPFDFVLNGKIWATRRPVKSPSTTRSTHT